MKLKVQAPKVLTWAIALLLVILGVVAQLFKIDLLQPYGFWLVLIGYVVLLLGTLIKGL